MKSAERRKRMLVIESDVNRTRLAADLEKLIGSANIYLARGSVVSVLENVGATLLEKLINKLLKRDPKRDPKYQVQAAEPSAWGRTAIAAVTLLTSVFAAMQPSQPTQSGSDRD